MPKPLWQAAEDGDLKEVERRTSTAEGRKEINTSKDSVRDIIFAEYGDDNPACFSSPSPFLTPLTNHSTNSSTKSNSSFLSISIFY